MEQKFLSRPNSFARTSPSPLWRSHKGEENSRLPGSGDLKAQGRSRAALRGSERRSGRSSGSVLEAPRIPDVSGVCWLVSLSGRSPCSERASCPVPRFVPTVVGGGQWSGVCRKGILRNC